MMVSLAQAVARIHAGEVVAVPTETVYGLAASYANETAIACIYALKKRPRDNPLIVHIGSLEDLSLLTDDITPMHEALIQAFWPGPLTLLFSAHPTLSSSITAGQPTVAIRFPEHPLFLELLAATGPLVAPSANLSGTPSATKPSHIVRDFGEILPLLDGGEAPHGLESTILSCCGGTCSLLRKGAIPQEALEKIIPFVKMDTPHITVPGSKYRHYAPKTPLYPLGKEVVECVIGYKDRRYRSQHTFILGSSDDPSGIAKHLYSVLRAVDYCHFGSVYVDMDLPNVGLYQTIQERLQRAISATTLDSISQ